MSLLVITEGVKTEAQRDFLRRDGCHANQVYLLGSPGLVSNLNRLLNPNA